MSVEKRNIRIEDWEGNSYYPESANGITTAGNRYDAADASTLDPSAAIYSEGTLTGDSLADGGTSLLLQGFTGGSEKILYKAVFNDIPFGTISVNMRLKSSLASGQTRLIKVESIYFDQESSTESTLEVKYFIADDIGEPNTYVDLGTTMMFAGYYTGTDSLMIRITLLPVDCTVQLDYISVAPCLTMEGSGSGADIYVMNDSGVPDENGHILHLT